MAEDNHIKTANAKICAIAAAALLTPAISGCDAINPASVCTNPETYRNVRLLLAKKIGLTSTEDEINNALDAIGIGVPFDLPALVSYDKDTKKVTCSAQFHLKSLPIDPGEHLDAEVIYTRQPTADGSTFIYSYTDNGAVEQVAPMAILFLAGKKSQAPPTPSQTPPPAEAPLVSAPPAVPGPQPQTNPLDNVTNTTDNSMGENQ